MYSLPSPRRANKTASPLEDGFTYLLHHLRGTGSFELSVRGSREDLHTLKQQRIESKKKRPKRRSDNTFDACHVGRTNKVLQSLETSKRRLDFGSHVFSYSKEERKKNIFSSSHYRIHLKPDEATADARSLILEVRAEVVVVVVGAALMLKA